MRKIFQIEDCFGKPITISKRDYNKIQRIWMMFSQNVISFSQENADFWNLLYSKERELAERLETKLERKYKNSFRLH